MSARPAAERPPADLLGRLRGGRGLWRVGLPVAALIVMLVVVFVVEPNAATYTGLSLVLASTVPLMLATMAQLCIIAIGDIDLGLGSAVGLVNVIGATWLGTNPPLAAGAYVAIVIGYIAMGALIHARRLPAIVVTLGASFVWLGLAILALPVPGGVVPLWLVDFFDVSPPLVPLPILLGILIAVVGHLLLVRSRYGVILRGAGGNPTAVERAGWSLLGSRLALYGLAGVFVVLAGLAVTGSTTSGDANASTGYTLISIAAVILGGGEFIGGVVAPVGAVVGAVTIGLVSALLTFLDVSSDYQIGVQGAILIAVLAGRAVGYWWRRR